MNYGDLFPGGTPYSSWTRAIVLPWCKRCQAGTPSVKCLKCERLKAACAVCERCPRCDGPDVGKDD